RRAVRGLLEDQGDAPAGEDGAGAGLAGEVQHAGQLVRCQVVDLEEVTGHSVPVRAAWPAPPSGRSPGPASSTCRRMARASSISVDDTRSGGARRTALSVTALTTRPEARARAVTSFATGCSSSAASNRPWPRTAPTPGRLAKP